MQREKRERGAVGSFMTLGTLFTFFYCALAAGAMLGLPMLGGGLYLALEGALLFAALKKSDPAGCLAVTAKWMGTALVAVAVLFALALAAMYPECLSKPDFWRLTGLALLAAARSFLTGYAARGKGFQFIGVQVTFLMLGLLLLSGLQPADMAWTLAGGFAFSGIVECFPLHRMNPGKYAFTDTDKAELDALKGVHARKMYRLMLLACGATLQTAQAAAFAALATAADSLILSGAVALVCVYAPSVITHFLLRLNWAKKADPNLMMGGGLILWLIGWTLFMRFLGEAAIVGCAVSIALCGIGATVCVQVLMDLKPDMRLAAAFALGHEPGEGMEQAQKLETGFSSLAGQMAALAGLTVICVFTGKEFSPAAFRSFSLFLTLPALGLLLALAVFFIGFPLRKLHLEKLRRYVDLQREGIENKQLRDQLTPVVIQKSVKNYGIRAVECVLRPFFFHRVQGAENVKLDKDIPCVFVCNHGEIFGPVVCTLFSPFPFRAWSAYEMLDKSLVIDRTMNGTFENVKGWKRKLLQGLMEHIGAPFLTWLLESEGCIAVYHDNPRKLMQSFRETITAMQAGDNILVFPENAATAPDHKYVEEGVSEFFTGFTMIGQMYANKTGQCPLFVPMYANKKTRLITFGVPTRYDADAPVNEEKERLCAYLRGEILRLAGVIEEKNNEESKDYRDAGSGIQGFDGAVRKPH